MVSLCYTVGISKFWLFQYSDCWFSPWPVQTSVIRAAEKTGSIKIRVLRDNEIDLAACGRLDQIEHSSPFKASGRIELTIRNLYDGLPVRRVAPCDGLEVRRTGKFISAARPTALRTADSLR